MAARSINAALDNSAHGPVREWIAAIRVTYVEHIVKFDQLTDPSRKHNKLVDLNVLRQVENLKENVVIKRALSDNQKISVHGWVYNIQNGSVTELTN